MPNAPGNSRYATPHRFEVHVAFTTAMNGIFIGGGLPWGIMEGLGLWLGSCPRRSPLIPDYAAMGCTADMMPVSSCDGVTLRAAARMRWRARATPACSVRVGLVGKERSAFPS